ncbi:uncharacterized protein SCHCODRAFT_02550531 [Schizophyllum commune H4-8]
MTLAALSAMAATFACVACAIRRRHHRAPLPPGPKGWPVIGNLLDIPSNYEWDKYMQWARELHAAGTSVIILDSYEACCDLLAQRARYYSDRRPAFPMTIDLMGMEFSFALISYGEGWQEASYTRTCQSGSHIRRRARQRIARESMHGKAAIRAQVRAHLPPQLEHARRWRRRPGSRDGNPEKPSFVFCSLKQGGDDQATVVTILNFVLAVLDTPFMQCRSQRDLDALLGPLQGADGELGQLPVFDDEERLPCITALVRENSRSRPVLPMSISHAYNGVEPDIYKGYAVPCGSIVNPTSGPFRSMTHDEKAYPDPYAFKPKRYLDADGKLDPNVRPRDDHMATILSKNPF